MLFFCFFICVALIVRHKGKMSGKSFTLFILCGNCADCFWMDKNEQPDFYLTWLLWQAQNNDSLFAVNRRFYRCRFATFLYASKGRHLNCYLPAVSPNKKDMPTFRKHISFNKNITAPETPMSRKDPRAFRFFGSLARSRPLSAKVPDDGVSRCN